MSKSFYVYILTNKMHSVLYTGVTNDIRRRASEHKQGVSKGFTKKYKVNKLVYVEVYDRPRDAIEREKQIKAGSRQKKIDLIISENPEWKDLADDL